MKSKQEDNKDKKVEEKNEKEDMKDVSNDIDFDIDKYHEKKRYRNTMHTQKPFVKQEKSEASSFYVSDKLDYKDFLKKKHLFIISKYEQIVLLSSDIYKKIEENLNTIKELDNELKKLKEEKKKKQNDIVNYLANKESLEEIYKNKIRFIIKQKNKDNDINLNLDNAEDNNQLYNINDEKEIEIKIEEIKNSDQKKYIEQIINFTEEILNKKDDNNQLESKIKISYNIFLSEI